MSGTTAAVVVAGDRPSRRTRARYAPTSIKRYGDRTTVPSREGLRHVDGLDALGFTKELDADEVAIYPIGTTSFPLQDHYQEEWAGNFMTQLLVDDLAAWWPHLISLRGSAPSGGGV